MIRPRLAVRLLALCVLPCLLSAEEGKPAAPAKPNIEVSTGGAGTTPRKKQRAVSTDVSKSVSSAFKYNPPPPPKPEEELVDMREIDKPRNEIIRLPKYLVEAKRPPVFNDRNLYSKEMLRRLAYQRYMGSFGTALNKYKLPIIGGGAEAYAMMQYEAEERRQNMAEMADKVSMYRISGDSAEADQLKADAQDAFMRRTEFGTTPQSQSPAVRQSR